jgi:hypothetical protein
VREAMLSKLEGLSEYDIRRPLIPTGTNLLGLIKHLSIVRVLEETNRHADILREQLDGAAGIATDNPNLPQHDAAW